MKKVFKSEIKDEADPDSDDSEDDEDDEDEDEDEEAKAEYDNSMEGEVAQKQGHDNSFDDEGNDLDELVSVSL